MGTVGTGTTVASFKGGFAGVALMPGDDGYDEARAVWNGVVRQAPGPDRAMRDDRGRRRGDPLRARQRAGARGPERRAQPGRALDVRGRRRGGSLADANRGGGRGRARGAGPGRRDLGGLRRGDAGRGPRQHRRADLAHRRRGAHARRRHRLADAQARPRLRQPGRGRPGDRRRRCRPRRQHGGAGAPVGPPGRRRQLRRRDELRVPAAPGRAGARRAGRVPDRPGPGGAPRLPWMGGGHSRRIHDDRDRDHRAPRAVRAARAGRAEGGGDRWLLVQRSRRGAGAAAAAAGARARDRRVRTDALPGPAGHARRGGASGHPRVHALGVHRRPRRRVHRRGARARRRDALPVLTDPPAPDGRRRRARGRGGHGLREPARGVRVQHQLDVDGSGRGRDARGRERGDRRGDDAVLHRRRVREFPRERGGRARPRRVRRCDLRPPRRAQADLRPDEPVPPEPEHPSRLRRREALRT